MLSKLNKYTFLTIVYISLLATNARGSEVVDVSSNDQESDQTEEQANTDLASPTADKQVNESLPQAENIDLSEPTVAPQPETPAVPPEEPETTDDAVPLDTGEATADATEEPSPAPEVMKPLVILNTKVAPATTTRLSWSPDQSFEAIATPAPVLIAHGNEPGPILCLTAAIHGDELNGIEIVRSVMYDIDASELKGTVIGVPIVNLQGFRRSSRYLTDRRDLNRFFPGTPNGSSASRIAHSFFNQVIQNCTYLVDLHTGSFYRTNLPQLRANLRDDDVLTLTKAFDAIAVLHSEGAIGTLRRAAVDAGIPAVTLEAGGPMELNEAYVIQGAKAVNTLLDKLGMLNTLSFWGNPQPAYYSSLWVRADQGGILFSEVKLGAKVRKGDILGRVTDPITNLKSLIFSPVNGRVIGMAVNQVVLPGFAAYHIGINPGKRDALPTAAPADVGDDNAEEGESAADDFD